MQYFIEDATIYYSLEAILWDYLPYVIIYTTGVLMMGMGFVGALIKGFK